MSTSFILGFMEDCLKEEISLGPQTGTRIARETPDYNPNHITGLIFSTIQTGTRTMVNAEKPDSHHVLSGIAVIDVANTHTITMTAIHNETNDRDAQARYMRVLL